MKTNKWYSYLWQRQRTCIFCNGITFASNMCYVKLLCVHKASSLIPFHLYLFKSIENAFFLLSHFAIYFLTLSIFLHSLISDSGKNSYTKKNVRNKFTQIFFLALLVFFWFRALFLLHNAIKYLCNILSNRITSQRWHE